MPGFTPGRRWQPPFLPFKREPFEKRLLRSIEVAVKGPLFGCRMCGNCMLQETALICPMECPKGLRNGPCGGSTPDGCYVDPSRPCIWYKIYERAFSLGREELLLEVLPPVDWDQVGTETWGTVLKQVRAAGVNHFLHGMLSRNVDHRKKIWQSVFRPLRQPDWWRGDDQYHVPAYQEPISNLECQLKQGKFVVAAEITPPAGIDTSKLRQNIELLKPYVTALNFTDAASSTPRMSSLACSEIALEFSSEPVLQVAARDCTRIGLQGMAIGACARGIRNILVISGDTPRRGLPPFEHSDWIDLDSVQMLWLLRRMRDDGIYLDGREIKSPPKYFLGAAASPFAATPRIQALREHKKVNAGAQFFQTNVIFDVNRIDDWLNALAQRNILDKVYILAGITPLKSYKMAVFMNQKVPGVYVPDLILKRMQHAAEKGGEQEEGLQIAIELIEKIRPKQGINGIHLMPVGWEAIIPKLIQSAGLEHNS
ncbi:MAG: methylenetetrahydrofolate reductase C-terminal domain-containing protein [Chloroflexota bacterium]